MSEVPNKPWFVGELANGNLLIIDRTKNGDRHTEYRIVTGGNFRFDSGKWIDDQLVADELGNQYRMWQVGAEIPNSNGGWSLVGFAYVDPSIGARWKPQAFAISLRPNDMIYSPHRFTHIEAVKINEVWYMAR